MALDENLRRTLALPAVCAPMMLVSGPELVLAACKAGIMAGLPAHNARDPGEFDSWLARITDELQRHREIYARTPVGPVAVNVSAVRPADERSALPTVAELVRRLLDEYSTACNLPDMRRAASR
jgi:nitronate monooxygenase